LTARVRSFAQVTTILILGLAAATCWAAEPTLARLSFWVPPERTSEFERVYEGEIVPLVTRYGLAISTRHGRPTIEKVFSRVLEADSPAIALRSWEGLSSDPEWRDLLRRLREDFGTTSRKGRPIPHCFDFQHAPAGPGKVTVAGPGRGHWRTYDETDGLSAAKVRHVHQDRRDNIWFATSGGVCRYDGYSIVGFAKNAALAKNNVWHVLEDRDGRLWFSTYGDGVIRYDPHGGKWSDSLPGRSDEAGPTWSAYTTDNGLVDNRVNWAYQDTEGNIWFATWAGASRFDGETWTSFTTEDGLANNEVRSIAQDDEGRLWFTTRGGGVSRFDPRAAGQSPKVVSGTRGDAGHGNGKA
jgi:hypothetical protein